MAGDHRERQEGHHHDEDLVRVRPPGVDPVREPRGDRGEDHQRDAVADAALGDQLAEPHQEDAAGGERHHDHEDAAEGEVLDDVGAAGREGPEQEHVADRLAEGERHGQVARVLGDLLLPDLALLAELVERRHHDRQQLQHDRRRDVGHDPEREDREALERAAREQVEEAEHARAREVVRDVLDRVDVDPRRGDVGAEPVEGEHARREGELLPDLGNPERVQEGPEHPATPRSVDRCRPRPRSSREPSSRSRGRAR